MENGMRHIPLGEILEERFLISNDQDIKKMSDGTGIPAYTIRRCLTGLETFSKKYHGALARYFGTSIEFWDNLNKPKTEIKQKEKEMKVEFKGTRATVFNASNVKVAEFDNVCQMVQCGNTAWMLESTDGETCDVQLLTRVTMKGEVLSISPGVSEKFIEGIGNWYSSETYLLPQGRVVLLTQILDHNDGVRYNRFLIPTKYGMTDLSYEIDEDGYNTYHVTYDKDDELIISLYVSDNHVSTDHYRLSSDGFWSYVFKNDPELR